MKFTHKISRYIVGLVFIFSGFVKAIDPLGSTYKFTDYFVAFHMDFLSPLSLPLAFIISSLEFIIGICLLLNTRIKNASYLALLFMLFFTPLTLLLAITNPVTDCGCFGDALIITNWETFFKNIILLILALFIFKLRNTFKAKSSNKEQALFIISFTIFIISINVYSYKHLPIVDFRPYSIGSNISEGMIIPENAKQAIFKTEFTYKKDNVIKQFDETNYPWQDSTWVFVDSKQIKIKDGYQAPIHDFSIENSQDGDITEEILNSEQYTFIMISKDINEINIESLDKFNDIYKLSLEKGYRFICLSSSIEDEVAEFKHKNNINYDFYSTDEIQLKTIIRSNPGLVLIKNGTILNKWHFNDIPKSDNLKTNLTAKTLKQQQLTYNKFKVIGIIIIILLIISLYNLFIRKRE